MRIRFAGHRVVGSLLAAALFGPPVLAQESTPPAASPESPAPPAAASPAASPAADAAPKAARKPRAHPAEGADAGTAAAAPPAPAPAKAHAGLVTHPDGGTAAHGEAHAEPAKPLTEQEQALGVARQFFTSLLAGDIHGAIVQSAFPFALEDRKIATAQDAAPEWNRQLRGKRTDLLSLQGLELLTPAEMEKRYGKPPARLSGLPIHAAKTWFAIANLSGHPAVAVLHEEGLEKLYKVVGYTD